MAKCTLCPKEATATSKLGHPVCPEHKASDDANVLGIGRPKKDDPKKKEKG
jgi:hypothetical protein